MAINSRLEIKRFNLLKMPDYKFTLMKTPRTYKLLFGWRYKPPFKFYRIVVYPIVFGKHYHHTKVYLNNKEEETMSHLTYLQLLLRKKETLRLEIASLPDMNQKVLDHGYVQYVDHLGGDKSVSMSARVSYDDPARDEDEKLLRYLMKNSHNTPFESSAITFEIKAPIFILRQWHRHRTQSYNEVSARYTPLPEEFYVPELDQITTQSKDNKQMRTTEQHPQALVIQNAIYRQNVEAFRTYKSMLEDGAPRELARTVLPTGTYSRMFATANLLNWYKFLGLRLHAHAQYEIRVYADAMLAMLDQLYPVATAAFKRYHLGEGDAI